MIRTIAFDNEKYLKEQTAEILERAARFGNRLYLEFGGKLFYDYHAARVLPGYDPNVKTRLLQELKDKADILLCIYAGDIERKKIRADFGITYDSDAMKLIDDLRARGISVPGVVITRFDNQPSAILFKNKLERRGIRVYTHRMTRGYPTDIEVIVSDEGYGANTYIETEKPSSSSPGRALAAASSPPAFPSSITTTAGAFNRDTRSSKPSPSGTCRSSIPSMSPMKPPRRTSAISISSIPSTWRRIRKPR